MFDKVTYKLLKRLYKHGKLTEQEVNAITYEPEPGHSNKHILFLSENKLIESKRIGEEMDSSFHTIKEGITVYTINLKGRAFVEQRRRDFLGFLIPYSITTFIAILSLISVIAANWNTIESWFH